MRTPMTVAIVNATALDGTGRDPVPNATVIKLGAGVELPRAADGRSIRVHSNELEMRAAVGV